jgi:hypothetical protein
MLNDAVMDKSPDVATCEVTNDMLYAGSRGPSAEITEDARGKEAPP